MRFADRSDAGKALAKALSHHAGARNLLVLGLPRGGVPVAAAIAQSLGAPLDIFLVRKLGVPGRPELALGAIAGDGVRILNTDVINSLRIPDTVIEEVTQLEKRELCRRQHAYRDGRPPSEFSGKIVILVDDGVATGSTMLAAVAALRERQAQRIVVAVPVIAAESLGEIRQRADEVVYILSPDDFYGVGQWYADFTQTSDEEVRHLLARTRKEQ